MNLRPGYQRTEIGQIPNDWSVRRLSELTSEIGDGIHTTPEYSTSSAYHFINGNNLVDGCIKISDTTMCVSQVEWLMLRKNLSDRTILLSINGTIGNLAFYNGETVVLGKRAAYLNVTPAISTEYIYYALSTSVTDKYFEDELTGTTIKNLSLASLRNTPVAIPNEVGEQRAIAAALSDTDALLISLDLLLAKKRDIKQAIMQQFLTGKQRLPGFRAEWEVKRLGDISYCLKGRGLSKTLVSTLGNNKCILYGQLFTTYGRVISDVVSRTSSNDGVLSEMGDILMPGSTTTVGIDLATASAVLEKNVLLGGDIIVIRKQRDYDAIFMANYLTYIKKAEISERAQGITIIHLYGKDLVSLPLCLPEMAEQTAIATVLSDMDAEIDALQQRRDKTRALKQGMMQELLTGRTRLV